jgi:cytochrome c
MSTCRPRFVAVLAISGIVLCVLDGRAQVSRPYGVGHSPTEAEIRAWGSDIGPNGENLPPGGADPMSGRAVYLQKCAQCHGATGVEGPSDRLAGGVGTLASDRPIKTVGSYWPYATTLWDYVNRAMPFAQPGSLSSTDVYGVVAYVLFLNKIIGEQDRVDHMSLPKIRMPNRDGFVPDRRPDARP